MAKKFISSCYDALTESLRLLSLHDNKYLRYFKGHHDRFGISCCWLVICCCLSVSISGTWALSLFICRVVSLSLCPRSECFISGSLDRTVLLWDQRAEKCQVAMLVSYLLLASSIFWLMTDIAPDLRAFYVFKEDLLHRMTIKAWCLQLHLEDT